MSKISLVLPYWCRQAAANRALAVMEKFYRDLSLEIIVVDDGSPVPFVAPNVALDIRVVRLPFKTRAKNPCTPINHGVMLSGGEFIALSNPESTHRAPILAAMRDAIAHDNDYVMAAAWCPDQNRWHCHSSVRRQDGNDVGAYLPPGADYHFMSMMRRELWGAAGGFDEDYRDGAGYDDPDFVRRLHAAGANFVMRDDLVVEHARSGAHAEWTAEGFARNRAIFMSKWRPLREMAA